MKAGPASTLLLVALGLATFVASQNSTSADPEINSSILIFGPNDYLQNGGQSRCQQMVANAASYHQSRVMFVPTLFWVDDSALERKTVNSQGKVTYFCINQSAGNTTIPEFCEEPTQEDIDLFTSSIAACFQSAVDAGLGISISPHLDDGLGLGGWRNGLVFDPLVKYSNYTYADFMLYPLADALNQVLGPTTKVQFAMQGEMSATVMYYPDSYIELLTLLRERILVGKPDSYSDNIKIGISTNFNKLCGCVLQDLVDPSQYIQLYPAAFAPLRSQFNMVAISELYNSTDFIGISSYPSLQPDFATEDLEAATEQFDFEVGQFGVNLTDLIFNQGKELYWNEYGVGGGTNQSGTVKATTALGASENPFFGVFGVYSQATDPWVLYDLSQPSPVRDYLRYFWNQTVAYAQQTGSNPAFKYIVSGIFIWDNASWDVEAIYPESTTTEGSYRDPVSVGYIDDHNSQSMAAQSGDAGLPISPLAAVTGVPPVTAAGRRMS